MLKTFNTLKRCANCEHLKFQKEFSKNEEECDSCRYRAELMVESAKTEKIKKKIISAIYSSQKNSSKKRGHIPPTYSIKELEEWLLDQNKFHYLYKEWVKNGQDRWSKPSVDRINDSIGYTMSNIQLMTWKENKTKSHMDTRSGNISNTLKRIIVF